MGKIWGEPERSVGWPQMGFVNPITYCTVGKILLRKKESNQSYAGNSVVIYAGNSVVIYAGNSVVIYAGNSVVIYAGNSVVTYARLEGLPQARPPHGGPERVRRVALESG